MFGIKSTFKELDESYKVHVRLGDNKQFQVEEKGMVAIKTGNNEVKFLHNVFFVPSPGYNLLSVGQLITAGYSVLFDNGACVIKEKKSSETIVNVYMTEDRCFLLKFLYADNHAQVVEKKNYNSLWHLRYEHLNVNGLRLLNRKSMVLGLPKINSLDLCVKYV
ncbi:hypothetical protein JRO89_XS09G0070700 [Xanthoceras sorbifolium]|uniref:GAG-pre-integrase domain-containing protein n=1 Tax=Xanthoceras sorbifolium TaxID=99658 RepID=A0ABQ8HKN4_9ROSI|nr:hypothetical protein JRO89_XS09G0070700 [Xanthoceras sorbifolium]